MTLPSVMLRAQTDRLLEWGMRLSSSSGVVGLVAAAGLVTFAGCGPAGPSSLEGFTDGFGDGDGDSDTTGDGDPTGDGDGDGDPQNCLEANLGSDPEIYFEGALTDNLANDFPGTCSDTPAGDYAFAWTAPFSGSFQANLWPDFNGSLTLLEGGCSGKFYDCSTFEFPNSLNFDAIAGQLYTFVIDGEFAGYFSFELYPYDVMPGSCPDGFLAGVSANEFGSTVGGGYDFGSGCGGQDAPDRTFLFVPEQDGVYRIDTYGSNFDTVVYALDGFCGGFELACNDDEFDSVQSVIEVQMFAGNEYTIVVDGYGGDSGSFALNVELVGGQQSLCDDVLFAPSDPSFDLTWWFEDSSADLFQACSPTPFERRILWVAPEDGTYAVTQLPGANYSSVTVLLDGCQGNQGLCLPPDNNLEVHGEFEAFAGQEILFVSEWSPDTPDDITFVVESLGSGSCGEDLGSTLPLVVQGTTMGSGDDFEGSCSGTPAPEVELQWTAPAAGNYQFSLEGSDYDTLMYIRDGGCDGPQLACNDDTMTMSGLELWSTINLDLSAGQTVSIFVDAYSGVGNYVLSVSGPP